MDIPSEVLHVCGKLISKGHKAYLVGGCVRDSFLFIEPKDWDVTTDATPEEIKNVFPGENIPTGEKFGTITILHDSKMVEVTTMRSDGKYSDNRHPDHVTFTNDINDDLKRRDFTVNAMAFDVREYKIISVGQSIEDLNSHIIRTVGSPTERFKEDPLRILRGYRFIATLPGKWIMNETTLESTSCLASLLNNISKERIASELCKLIVGNNAKAALRLMEENEVLEHILPELSSCVGVAQNKHHVYDVFGHIIEVVHNIPPKLNLRLAALFHDIGKPKCKIIGDDGETHFYKHELESAKIAYEVMRRLKMSNDIIENVVNLVRHHMFCFDIKSGNERTARRLIASVGRDNILDQIELRKADQMGSKGRISEWTLRLVELVNQELNKPDPLKLAVNGNIIMQELGLKPGKEVGKVIDYLKEKVIDNPELNNTNDLVKLIHEVVIN